MCVCLLFIFKTRERKREIEILNVSNKNRVMLMSVFKVLVGSQIAAHTLMETGNGPNEPNTINL